MLYYPRIDGSVGNNINKTNESKECNICHYWYFLGKWFKFQADVGDGCRDVCINNVYEP